MELVSIVGPIFCGILTGAGIAVLGYAKSRPEPFERNKFVQTAIVGGVIGGIAGYQGISYEAAEVWFASAGLITLVEYVKKIVLKIEPVKNLISKIFS